VCELVLSRSSLIFLLVISNSPSLFGGGNHTLCSDSFDFDGFSYTVWCTLPRNYL
jgi:hypothetical protein